MSLRGEFLFLALHLPQHSAWLDTEEGSERITVELAGGAARRRVVRTLLPRPRPPHESTPSVPVFAS